MLHGTCMKEKYQNYNKVLRNTIRRTKTKFYHDMCHEYKCQTKKLWGLINEISGRKNDKSSLIEYLKINDVKEYNARKISNSFGKYFSTVGEKFAKSIPNPKKPISEYLKILQRSTQSVFLAPTDVVEITKLVTN